MTKVEKIPAIGNALYVVATPLGNLRDISLRALDVLAAVDVIAAEDTRVTSKLLARHGIATRMLSLHAHNERRRAVAAAGRKPQNSHWGAATPDADSAAMTALGPGTGTTACPA